MLSKKLCSQLLDGGLTDHKKYLSGSCKGFHVTVSTTENGMYCFRISAHSENDPENAALHAFAESRKEVTPQIRSVNVYPNQLIILSTRTVLIKKVPAHLNEAILPIIDFLAENNYVSGCMQCGTQEAQVDCYEINGIHQYLCSNCVGRVEESLLGRQLEILSKKSKLLPGIVGALLGSMIGCVVYFFLWQVGYIAAIAGVVTALCAFKGYEMLGGVVDKKGVFACIAAILFSVYFANRLVWTYYAYTVYQEIGLGFFDCFRHIKEIIELNDAAASYYGYMALAYVMTVLGSFSSVVGAFKASTGSYKIKKMKD